MCALLAPLLSTVSYPVMKAVTLVAPVRSACVINHHNINESSALTLVMQGIVGGTYDRYLEGEAAVSKPEDQLYIPDDVSPVFLPCSRMDQADPVV